ncbi:MAG: ubiquinone-binding protein [Chromatiales bacterium]|jgi:ribosome-associated toxin RatA of RatAB toxin-antitoxin module|nr:ubiquinone-binding protein [Chromatiales bacterium]MDP6150979.1 type II toxin-antitoxin system RatA family toxin [Gammaproteobacteria bacterium]MDP7094302.1 type II toxin-antitoxin system RatA family toxin [Gammaproteobacteria bacterium]MDP7271912.1 type II toxin-antitoxin system RatA family toxin [Gammaproteobacteria bacterium]HJP04051.1 type II toxin-antitoxin system RatA family toxin [Gammaproteobacteria bacterium]
MRVVNRNALVPYSAEAMYRLVDNVESYPEFLPWCAAAELISRDTDELVAGLTIGYGALNSQFTTRNKLKPPEQMTMELLDGPFSSLEGVWSFGQVGEQGCEVKLHVEFEFSSAVQDALFGGTFELICNELIDAFIRRAHDLYG